MFFVLIIFLSFIFYRFTYYELLVTNKNNLSPYIPYTTPYIPTPTPPPIITVGFVGDLGLGRHITSTARAKNDFSWSFAKISPWLTQNSFNVANLESPIISRCPLGPTGTFTFCGDAKFIPQLYSHNFVLNLNNNHTLNYGSDGLAQTKTFLPDISFYDNLFIKEIAGLKFGFLGYDFITYPSQDRPNILTTISTSRPKVDYLIVSIHWGNEYLSQPEPWRIKFAHQMIDSGADIIHGHHPHVWQGVESYHDKLIFYSFGNFIFDQSWSYETSHSQIARVSFQKGESLKYQLLPIEIKFNTQPALTP